MADRGDKSSGEMRLEGQKVTHFRVARFIFWSCAKLKLNSVTHASACILYHRFYQECKLEDYDPYTIAATAIFLATKVEEQHTRLRDVVNVCYATLHPDKPRLEIGNELYDLKDTISSCELLVLRMLQFRVTCDHPHKYLAHYLMSLSQLFNSREWQRYTIAQTSWALLKDAYHGTICLEYEPPLVAVSCIALALEICQAEVPMSKSCNNPWWKVFHDCATEEQICEVTDKIVDLYDLDKKCFP